MIDEVMLRKILPKPVKAVGRKAIKLVKYNYRRVKITLPVYLNRPIKIIVGAAETHQPGWYSTNECWLDITRDDHWRNIFKGRTLVTHVVAEHVFEHLTYEEAQRALRYIHAHMVPGGRIRIAVPDGYHPDPEYQRHVGIEGIGDDGSDHKQLLNVDVLGALLSEAGFKPMHIEGYTAGGELKETPYATHDGFIMRSRANKNKTPWYFRDANTSLIVDGIRT